MVVSVDTSSVDTARLVEVSMAGCLGGLVERLPVGTLVGVQGRYTPNSGGVPMVTASGVTVFTDRQGTGLVGELGK
jgi:hypothetical protein